MYASWLSRLKGIPKTRSHVQAHTLVLTLTKPYSPLNPILSLNPKHKPKQIHLRIKVKEILGSSLIKLMIRGASNVNVMAVSKQNAQTKELSPSKRSRRSTRLSLNPMKRG